jgi:hypothetical protein
MVKHSENSISGSCQQPVGLKDVVVAQRSTCAVGKELSSRNSRLRLQ